MSSNPFANAIAVGPLEYKQPTNATRRNTSSTSLDMDSFLQLMAMQLQNQDPMNPSDQDNYMMQLAQMAVVETMTSMMETSITTYAASMVGKEVTAADIDAQGNITTTVGTVTCVALYQGEPVIYINDKAYSLSQIMAVGSLPEGDTQPEE